jgi:hypothetical protein
MIPPDALEGAPESVYQMERQQDHKCHVHQAIWFTGKYMTGDVVKIVVRRRSGLRIVAHANGFGRKTEPSVLVKNEIHEMEAEKDQHDAARPNHVLRKERGLRIVLFGVPDFAARLPVLDLQIQTQQGMQGDASEQENFQRFNDGRTHDVNADIEITPVFQQQQQVDGHVQYQKDAQK